MKVLVVGGSGFLSSAIVDCLLVHKHSISTFQRKPTGRDNIEEILVDISDSERISEVIEGRNWDCVIDVDPTVQPNVVKDVINALKGSGIKHYTFISSIGVYKDFSQNIDEDSLLADIPEGSVNLSGATFGGLKVANENAIKEEMGTENTLIVRPGLIIGPHDASGRFSYWVERFLRTDNDPVLAPNAPDWPTQAIDVRDLANWIVEMAGAHESGIYNAAIDYTFKEIVEELQTIAQESKKIVWVPHSHLLDSNVKPYMQLPLWVPPHMIGLVTANCDKAKTKGLSARPIRETISQTAAWLNSLTKEEKVAMVDKFYSAIGTVEVGLSQEKENKLINSA